MTWNSDLSEIHIILKDGKLVFTNESENTTSSYPKQIPSNSFLIMGEEKHQELIK